MAVTVCGGWSAYRQTSYGLHAITLWCRSWRCADCFPKRLRQLKRTAAAGDPTTFLTLTVNPAFGEGPDDRARHLVHAFRTMLKRATRKFAKQPLAYLVVFERTKKGEPHLHVLMRAPFIPQRWISDTMAELIDAPVVDIRQVKNKAVAAAYIAKYVSKGPQQFGTLKRYWMTRTWRLSKIERRPRDESGASVWRVIQEPLWLFAESIIKLGHQVLWQGEHEFIHIPQAAAPPEGTK